MKRKRAYPRKSMKRILGFAAFIAAAACCSFFSSRAMGAEVRLFRGVPQSAGKGPIRHVARLYLDEHASALGIDGISLVPDERVGRFRDHVVVRFWQEVMGLPLFGRGAILRLDKTGRVTTVVTFTEQPEPVHFDPVVSEAEAEAEVARIWGASKLSACSVTPGVLPVEGRFLFVYRIDGNTVHGRVRGFVDAETSQVVRTMSLAKSAPGRVYPANPVATPEPVLVELDNLTVDATTLVGRAGTVYHLVSGSLDEFDEMVLDQLATDDGSGFLYEPYPAEVVFDDPFAEVNLYYHVDRIDSYFRDRHGHTPFRKLVVVANYFETEGEPFDNAFSTALGLNTHGLFFGQGSSTDFGYDGDVVYHEFGHFVVDEVAGVGYIDELFDETGMHFGPGGIHEGLADYFSSSLMDDSLSAEYALGEDARNLENESVCPDHVVGEPHDDGWIIGGTAWEVRTTLDSSMLADSLVFGAVTLLSPSPTYQEFGEAVLETARTMHDDGILDQGQLDSVESVLTRRGLLLCGRFLPLDGGAERTTRPFGYDWLSSMIGSECEKLRLLNIWLPSAFQYTMEVPQDAQALWIRVRHEPGDRILYRVLVRRDEPLGFKVQPLYQGLSVVFPRQFDHEFEESSKSDGTVVLSTASHPPLLPGGRYYISVMHQNCPDTSMTVSAWTTNELPSADGGMGGDGGQELSAQGGGGCTCRKAGGSHVTSNPFMPWTALVLLLVLCLGVRFDARRHRAATSPDQPPSAKRTA